MYRQARHEEFQKLEQITLQGSTSGATKSQKLKTELGKLTREQGQNKKVHRGFIDSFITTHKQAQSKNYYKSK